MMELEHVIWAFNFQNYERTKYYKPEAMKCHQDVAKEKLETPLVEDLVGRWAAIAEKMLLDVMESYGW